LENKRKRPPTAQRGYVLVFTIAVLAAVAIAAAHFAERINKAVQLAWQRQNHIDQLIGFSDAQAEILFRLGTQYFTANGLGTTDQQITLDDRLYAADGNTQISLQDCRGLLNLNITSDERLHKLLDTYGITFNEQGSLIDKLHDYIDTDNFKRLNGAEAAEYEALLLPPPRNAPLLTPTELKAIPGWKDTAALWAGLMPVTELTTSGQSVALNPNTAPWQILATLPGVSTTAAKKLVERRNLYPNVDDAIIAATAGISASDLAFQVMRFPADTIRVTQTAAGLNWAIRYNVRLTPFGEYSPWSIDYYTRKEISRPANTDEHDQDNARNVPPPLPPRSGLVPTTTEADARPSGIH
jgi:type II secretory pathway component PulK